MKHITEKKSSNLLSSRGYEMQVWVRESWKDAINIINWIDYVNSCVVKQIDVVSIPVFRWNMYNHSIISLCISFDFSNDIHEVKVMTLVYILEITMSIRLMYI